MGREIVEDHDIARLQGWHEELFHPCEEAFRVDGAVEDTWRRDAVMTQCCNEGHGQPVPPRCLGLQRPAPWAPAMGGGHIGLGPGLIDKDKSFRCDPLLVFLPLLTPEGNIRPVLLVGEYGFF